MVTRVVSTSPQISSFIYLFVRCFAVVATGALVCLISLPVSLGTARGPMSRGHNKKEIQS